MPLPAGHCSLAGQRSRNHGDLPRPRSPARPRILPRSCNAVAGSALNLVVLGRVGDLLPLCQAWGLVTCAVGRINGVGAADSAHREACGESLRIARNPRSRGPADGPSRHLGAHGVRRSGARITRYARAEPAGRRVLCAPGFEPKRIAGLAGELLVTGVLSPAHSVVLLRRREWFRDRLSAFASTTPRLAARGNQRPRPDPLSSRGEEESRCGAADGTLTGYANPVLEGFSDRSSRLPGAADRVIQPWRASRPSAHAPRPLPPRARGGASPASCSHRAAGSVVVRLRICSCFLR